MVNLFSATPFPGTELYQECVKKGLIQSFDFGYGENYSESPIDGPDWDRGWAFETNYEYNLRVNFLANRNLNRFKQASVQIVQLLIQDANDLIYVLDHDLADRRSAVGGPSLRPGPSPHRHEDGRSLWS